MVHQVYCAVSLSLHYTTQAHCTSCLAFTQSNFKPHHGSLSAIKCSEWKNWSGNTSKTPNQCREQQSGERLAKTNEIAVISFLLNNTLASSHVNKDLPSPHHSTNTPAGRYSVSDRLMMFRVWNVTTVFSFSSYLCDGKIFNRTQDLSEGISAEAAANLPNPGQGLPPSAYKSNCTHWRNRNFSGSGNGSCLKFSSVPSWTMYFTHQKKDNSNREISPVVMFIQCFTISCCYKQ